MRVRRGFGRARLSWPERAASSYYTALCKGSSPPDRSSSTTTGKRKAGRSRSFRSSGNPTRDPRSRSIPARRHPTTSRSVRCASHGPSSRHLDVPNDDAGRRRCHRNRHREIHPTLRHKTHRHETRRREMRPSGSRQIRAHGTRRREIPPVKPSAAVGRSIGEVWLEHSSAQQSSCDYYQSPPASGSGAIFF